MKKLLKAYLKEITQTTIRGDAREESYYGTLEDLLESFPLEKSRKTQVTTLPKQTEAGNPDFRVWDGENFIVGYIEAKLPGTNLDQVETLEQLERYLGTFPNLILTDFYEFRLYRDGELFDRVSIGRHFTARQLRTTPPLENVDEFTALLEKFFAFKLPKSFTAEKLAVELAKRTRFLRDQVVAEELRDENSGSGRLFGFYKAFKKYLIATLTQDQFADLYSQTITYGLFAARTRAEGTFTRKMAFNYIPSTIGILRDVFRFISLEELSPQMEVIVDDISSVLNAADINSILDQYYKEGRGEDPIVHFYETFLSEYDPEVREKRGVYYTPEPVVKYIVRSVHHLLKEKFDLRDGLADPRVTVLDPAAGTLTFPAEAIRLAVEEYVGKYGEGGKKGFIRDQILKNYYAFELMMAPYAIGHMKISILLESLGYKLQADDRFQLYLTNTLEMEEIDQIDIPGIHSLSEESQLAGKIKKEEPILVIMGNPPYSGSSANRNEWTEELLKTDVDGAQSYYKVDGKPLGERNPKWLQDDYVKFLRFAQWKIQKAGKGIVAMITNHSYLDNPTFRGMRQSLMKTFDEIYILDLHGNSIKREKTPDGGRDDNVFDIRQGVAIALLIKSENIRKLSVYQDDLYGLRDEKYEWLKNNDFTTNKYPEVQPKSPYYFFIQRSVDNIAHYLEWMKINEIFPVNSVGIVTARDKLTIKWSKDEIWRTILNFSSYEEEFARSAYDLGKDVRDWKVRFAQKDIVENGLDKEKIKPILYRPFDIRYTYYTGNSRGFHCMPRPEVMKHMVKENIGLTVGRQGQVVGDNQNWNLIFVSDSIVDFNLFYRGGELIMPLYLYIDETNRTLFDSDEAEKKKNISPNLQEKLSTAFEKFPSPEDFANYIYGILYSNLYRLTYEEFLMVDYPRIPFTKNLALFNQMSGFGQRLVDLHLLKSQELAQPSVKFQGEGEDMIIGRRKYDEATQRVFINKDYYFEGVKPEVWEYQIGGYQVMDKYLKDRKGRRMDDPRHYIHIAIALEKTIEIQEEIDAIYPEVEKDLIEF